MKKIFFLAAATLLAASANAQLLVDEDIDMNEAIAKAPIVNADTKPVPYYEMPVGTYFSGFAKNCYRLNSPMLHVPAFADLTFVNGSSEFSSFFWTYVSSEGEYDLLNPTTTSSEETLTLNYQYLNPLSIEAPQITATNELGDSTTNLLTNTPVYMRVGGPSGYSTTAETNYGWMNVSPRANTSMSYSTNYFGTNIATAGEKWDNRLGATGTVVRGFGELYFKPAAPYALTGVATHVRPLASNYAKPGAVKATIYKVATDANGLLVNIEEEIASQTIQPDQIVEAGSSTNPLTRYYMAFNNLVDAKTGEEVEGYTVDYPVLVTITLADEEDGASQFSPYYVGVTNDMACHSYVVLDGVFDGAFETGVCAPANINWNGGTKTRGFAVSLMGSFEYLLGSEDHLSECEIAAPVSGGEFAVEVISSVPYVDELGLETQWTIDVADGNRAALPEWVSVEVNDNYVTVEGEKVYQNNSTINVNILPNTESDARETDVKVAFLGAQYTIHVTQEGVTTGIEDITVAQDDINAPTYNMMGQRVAPDTKGLLIRGGKKVLVK